MFFNETLRKKHFFHHRRYEPLRSREGGGGGGVPGPYWFDHLKNIFVCVPPQKLNPCFFFKVDLGIKDEIYNIIHNMYIIIGWLF